ncbi:MAG: acyl-ACP desaturase, partial [Acidimicrobiia bacterium]
VAMERQVREFEMPGTGIIGFGGHARAISRAGIYDYSVHHERILAPVVLRHWKVETLEGLSGEAERARDALVAHVDRVGRVGRHLAERRAEASDTNAAGQDSVLAPVDVLA